MENERKQRSPQEIIAETEERLERLRLKQAQLEAQTNPAVAELLDEKNSLLKDIRESKKLLGNGPQSAVVRIEKHKNWIAKIQDQQLEAESTLSSCEQRMDEISSEIAKAVQNLVDKSEESSKSC
jgi:capsule polysaccharide export protein KpsE/RkpR